MVFVPKYGIEGPVYLAEPGAEAAAEAPAAGASASKAKKGKGRDKNNATPGFVLDEEKQTVRDERGEAGRQPNRHGMRVAC